MPEIPPDIPDKVRLAAEHAGEAGAAWLAELPGALARIERDWGVRVGAVAGRSTEAYVVHAQTGEGRPAALKFVAPWIDPQRRELAILQAARGQGYAELLRADEDENILLLEGLGALLADAPMTEDERIAVICRTLPVAWTVRRPAAPAIPSGAERAAELAGLIEALWAAAARPCARRSIDAAMASAARRQAAFNPARAVLAHGDAHAWNTLASLDGSGAYKFIDPDGAFAEPAFDLGVLMREWGDRIPQGNLVELGQQRCALISGLSGVEDTAAIWDWALLQCLDSGLKWAKVGAFEAAAPQLAMADAWAAGVAEFA